MTLAQKIEPILNPVVMRQLIPAPGVEVFDPATFVQSTDTLILITDDQAQTNVAPLTTMLLNEVMDAAKHAAAISRDRPAGPAAARRGRRDRERRAGAEAAGDAQSDSRGIGVQWFPVFQSVAQILARWGEDDGSAILANLNCSMVLGGLQDRKGPGAVLRPRRRRWRSGSQLANIDAHSNIASQRMVTESERTVLRPEEVRRLPDGAGAGDLPQRPGDAGRT